MSGRSNDNLCLTIEISPDQVVEERELFQVLLSSTDEAVNITNGSALITIEDANESKFIYQLAHLYLSYDTWQLQNRRLTQNRHLT